MDTNLEKHGWGFIYEVIKFKKVFGGVADFLNI